MKAALLFSLPGKGTTFAIPIDTPISRLLSADRLPKGYPTHPFVVALVFLLSFPSGLTHSQVGVDAQHLVLRGLQWSAGGSDVAPLLVAQAAASAKKGDGPVSPAVLLAASPKRWWPDLWAASHVQVPETFKGQPGTSF